MFYLYLCSIFIGLWCIVEFPCYDKKVYSYLFYVFPYRVSIKNSINMEAFIAPTRDWKLGDTRSKEIGNQLFFIIKGTIYIEKAQGLCLTANLTFKWPSTHPNPSVFHTQRGVGRFPKIGFYLPEMINFCTRHSKEKNLNICNIKGRFCCNFCWIGIVRDSKRSYVQLSRATPAIWVSSREANYSLGKHVNI